MCSSYRQAYFFISRSNNNVFNYNETMGNNHSNFQIEEQETSLKDLLDNLYTSTMQKVDELVKDTRKLKEKYQL